MIENIELTPLPKLRKKGFDVLVRELGAADALRFLSMYEEGRGDFTKERQAWVDSMSIEEICQDIEGMREKGELL